MSTNLNPDILTHPKYRSDIDGLRGIAVLAVVAFHAFPAWAQGGFIGVDIFFVISGYLISTIIIGNLERDTFSFIEFYTRRIKRIFPALLLVLIVTFVIGWFILLPTEYRQLGKHLAGGVGFVSNFIYWNEFGYFNNASETKPLLHLWSLSVEEQFYIIWPMLQWLAWKKKFNLLTLTAFVAVASFALNIGLVVNDVTAAFYSPLTRFWEILTGSALAYSTIHRQNFKLERDSLLNRAIVCNFQSIIGIIGIAIGMMVINKNREFPGWWAVLPVLATVLIISAGPLSWFNRKVLANRQLVWFGLISFPLYLWHWPLLSFIRIIEEDTPARSLRIAAVLISILLAWLTYKFIEMPIRFGNNSKFKTITLSVLMLIIGFVGYKCYKQNGIDNRFKKQSYLVKQFSEKADESFHNKNCDNLFPIFKDFDACLLSKPYSPNVVIVGDSHANHYYKSLANTLVNVSVMNISVWSCLPFSSKTHQLKDKCKEKISRTLDFLKKQDSIKTIYLSGYLNYLAAGKMGIEARDWRLAPDELSSEEASSFINEADEVISNLISSKKNVVLLLDTPDLSFNIRSCYNLRPFRITQKTITVPCAIRRDEYERRTAIYNRTIEKIINKFPQIKTFDPKSLFCDENYCWAVKKNEPLYSDSDHLLLKGADLVIKNLLQKYPIPENDR